MMERIYDPNKRLALQLWIASAPVPLPLYTGINGAEAIESELFSLQIRDECSY